MMAGSSVSDVTFLMISMHFKLTKLMERRVTSENALMVAIKASACSWDGISLSRIVSFM